MKRFNHTIGFFAAAALAACTGDFESFNTNPDAVQSVDKKTYITTMQMDAVIPCSDVGANEFQRACNLMGDAFGGYLSPIQAFNGGSYTCTYDLDGTDYNNYPFSVAFTNVMPAWLNLKYAYQNGQVTDDVFAVAEVIKVMALQRTTDIYGPIPVSNFGQTENPYESQETVYKNLLTDLNAAIVVLKEYAANAGDARPLQKVDAVYQGDYAKWLKLANSVKLRMAMRIRFVEPALARTYAEEAVSDGVMTASDDGAWLKSSGSVQVYNPLEETWNAYNDTRMGATIDAYMNGYADPRLPAYFKTCEDGKYHGVRSGLSTMLKADYTGLSVPNVAKDTPVVWFLASEAAFLRAEGAMLGWEMGGDDESFYKAGIELSFLEHGLTAAAAAAYAQSTAEPPGVRRRFGRLDEIQRLETFVRHPEVECRRRGRGETRTDHHAEVDRHVPQRAGSLVGIPPHRLPQGDPDRQQPQRRQSRYQRPGAPYDLPAFGVLEQCRRRGGCHRTARRSRYRRYETLVG